MMSTAREDASTACLFLVQRLEGLGVDDPARADHVRLLVRDLETKSAELPDDVYMQIWKRVAEGLLPNQVRIRLEKGKSPKPNQTGAHATSKDGRRIKSDVVVVTVINEEFRAALHAFGINPDGPEPIQFRGHKYYRAVVRNGLGQDLTVYITMIGRPRNVPCTNACRDLLEIFDVRACILVGIGGGNKKKVKLADVVASTSVLDYEGGRSELRPYTFGLLQRNQPRIELFNVRSPMREYLDHLKPKNDKWHKVYAAILNGYPQDEVKLDPGAIKAKPKYSQGVILAGEKVLANGSLPNTARSHHDKIKAVDMEGSGFARTCDHCEVLWLVIRGISDFGDKTKADGWHIPASISAATLARIFLETEYRTAEDELVF